MGRASTAEHITHGIFFNLNESQILLAVNDYVKQHGILTNIGHIHVQRFRRQNSFHCGFIYATNVLVIRCLQGHTIDGDACVSECTACADPNGWLPSHFPNVFYDEVQRRESGYKCARMKFQPLEYLEVSAEAFVNLTTEPALDRDVTALRSYWLSMKPMIDHLKPMHIRRTFSESAMELELDSVTGAILYNIFAHYHGEEGLRVSLKQNCNTNVNNATITNSTNIENIK